MRKGFIAAAAAACLLVPLATTASGAPGTGAATRATTPTAVTAAAASDLAVGVNYHALHSAMTTAARAEVLSAVEDSGTSWVRIDAEWSALQPTSANAWDTGNEVARLDRRIREARLRGMSILLAIAHAPEWASGTTAVNGRPRNPADFANAVAWLAERYSGAAGSPLLKIDALELWPEPNMDWAWATEPSATKVSSFADLIKAAGPAARAANANLKVVVGGLSSSDVTWLNQFYGVNGVIGTYDAIGLHTYQSPGDATPEAGDEQWAQYFITGMKKVADLMDSKSDAAQIWATEFGWTSHDNTGYPGGIPPGPSACRSRPRPTTCCGLRLR